jgi:hypothetical protein
MDAGELCRRVVTGAEGAPRSKGETMNHLTRRLTAGLVTAAAGSLAAAAALASPVSADHPTAADYPPGPTAADYPPGPTVVDGGSAIIPCL